MKFFVLDRPETGTAQDGEEYTCASAAEGARYGEAPTCPACGKYVGMLQWLPPYRIELDTWGRHYADVIIPAGNGDLIISERFLDIYRSHGLTGLSEIQPVEVVRMLHRRKKPKEERPEYYKANVAHSETTVDEEASGMQWRPSQDDDPEQEWGLGELECPLCLRRKGQFVRQSRVVIKPETWTGEDIFEPRGGGAKCVVSSKFKEVCKANDIRGVRFIPAEQYERDSYPSESKQLLKWLRILENPKYDRAARQDAYRTLYFAAKNDRIDCDADFDPAIDTDPTVINTIRDRLVNEGLLNSKSH